MKPTIENLWNGHIQPCESCGENDPHVQELIILMDRNRKVLEQGLTNHQKDMLEKYTDCWEEYCCLITAQAFQDGFTLACRLLTEALCDV